MVAWLVCRAVGFRRAHGNSVCAVSCVCVCVCVCVSACVCPVCVCLCIAEDQ
jgi:hypothetical protein